MRRLLLTGLAVVLAGCPRPAGFDLSYEGPVGSSVCAEIPGQRRCCVAPAERTFCPADFGTAALPVRVVLRQRGSEDRALGDVAFVPCGYCGNTSLALERTADSLVGSFAASDTAYTVGWRVP